MEQIGSVIEPFDVAGLNDRSRRNWYPVTAGDLISAAGKLGTNRTEIEEMLNNTGFFEHTPTQ